MWIYLIFSTQKIQVFSQAVYCLLHSSYLHGGELLAVGPVHGGDGLQVQLGPLQVALEEQVGQQDPMTASSSA